MVSIGVLREFVMDVRVNPGPALGRHTVEQRTKRDGDRLLSLPKLLGRPRPYPRHPSLLFHHVAKSRGPHDRRKTVRLGKAKRIRTFRQKIRSPDCSMNHPKHAAKERLIDTVPHQKACARARTQYAL